MKKLKEFFANLTLRQILTVVLAGVLILTTAACSGSKATTPQSSNPSIGGGDMYPHADTERDTTAADAKARREIRQAEQRREKVLNPNQDYMGEETKPVKQAKQKTQEAVQSAQQTADDVGNSAQRAANEVGNTTQSAAKNAARNTQAGVENLKQNTQKAVDQAADAVDQAT